MLSGRDAHVLARSLRWTSVSVDNGSVPLNRVKSTSSIPELCECYLALHCFGATENHRYLEGAEQPPTRSGIQSGSLEPVVDPDPGSSMELVSDPTLVTQVVVSTGT